MMRIQIVFHVKQSVERRQLHAHIVNDIDSQKIISCENVATSQ